MLRKQLGPIKMLKGVNFEWQDYKVIPISITVFFLYFLPYIIRKKNKYK